MFEGILVIALALAYLALTPHSQIGAQQILAIVLMLIYQMLCQLAPADQAEGGLYADRLLSLVPLLAFALILFPAIAVQFSENLTRFFGWLALASTTFLLLMFRFVIA